MSIFDRIQRIAKANMNWLLDKVESPESELESKIKELEDAIAEGRQAAATYGATFRRMEIEAQSLRKQQDESEQKARAALAAGDETLARRALEDKVLAAQRVGALAPGIEQGRKSYQALTENLGKLQQQLRAVKSKLAELVARQRAAEAQKTFGKHFDRGAAAAVDGAAVERLEDQVLQAEAEAQIGDEIRRGTLTDLDLEQRSRDLQVEAELRALKEEAG